jgi:putrescine aminotransferase
MTPTTSSTDRGHLLDAYRRYYNRPLAAMFDAGKCPVEAGAVGHHIIDETGRRYLDFSAGYGVFALGHLDPDVQDAAQQQLIELASAPQTLDARPRTELLDTLAALAPGDLDHPILTGSGSESTEVAQLIARLVKPGRTKVIGTRTGYHGKTLGAMTVLGQRHLTEPFITKHRASTFVEFGDIAALKEILDETTLLVCVEPVVGGGYVTVPPDGYLTQVRQLCDEVGALMVVDEVQTGFGRTGTLFGIEHDGVVPDMLIVSKAMSGGHVPMSATIVRAPIYNAALRSAGGTLPFDTEMPTSTMACAAANRAVRKIVEEDLAGNAQTMGALLISELRRISQRYPQFAVSVEGRGLMIGVKVRNSLVEQALWLQMIHRGVMTGISMNTVVETPALRIFPPLNIGEVEIAELTTTFENALAALSQRAVWQYDVTNYWLVRTQFRLPRRIMRVGADMLMPTHAVEPPRRRWWWGLMTSHDPSRR